MSRDAVIESWLASMSESELIAQCFFWHDMALEHGRMYKAVNSENAKLRSFALELYEDQCDDCDKWRYRDRMRELGVEVD